MSTVPEFSLATSWPSQTAAPNGSGSKIVKSFGEVSLSVPMGSSVRLRSRLDQSFCPHLPRGQVLCAHLLPSDLESRRRWDATPSLRFSAQTSSAYVYTCSTSTGRELVGGESRKVAFCVGVWSAPSVRCSASGCFAIKRARLAIWCVWRAHSCSAPLCTSGSC